MKNINLYFKICIYKVFMDKIGEIQAIHQINIS